MTHAVSDKFQVTKLIASHPTDLCPGLQSYLGWHPKTYLIHGNPIVMMLNGSDCCRGAKYNHNTRAMSDTPGEYTCFETAMPSAWDVHNQPTGHTPKDGSTKEKDTIETQLEVEWMTDKGAELSPNADLHAHGAVIKLM